MLPKEIVKKVRQIEIKTSHLVNDIFAGQYHSVFKGQGIEFDEVREYQIGDDVRSIDWNVTARSGKPYVKQFVEERELTVMILVDVSASKKFASTQALKSQLAAEIAAVLAFSAIRNNDNVGLIAFTDKIEKFIPPRKGSKHVLRVIREILYFEPESPKTNIIQALEYLNQVATRKTIAFCISDFFDVRLESDIFMKMLSVIKKRHDIIPITLNDPLELEIPNAGLVSAYDAETNEPFYIDSSAFSVRQQYKLTNERRITTRTQLFRSVGIDEISLSTDTDYLNEMIRFFAKRKKRLR